MEATHRTTTVTATAPRLAFPSGPAVSAWLTGFALVAYLALANGGYDTVVRNQVGVVVWWLVLVAAAAGLVRAHVPPIAWVAIGLLAAFCLWTGLSAGWSESAERSAAELGKVATYLGILVIAVAVQGRTAARHTFHGVACAIGFVGWLAVLSRLHPQWFPHNDHATFLANSRRLSYPLNYWNGLAAFVAMGVPLMLAIAGGARRLAAQAAAAATAPVLALAIYFTLSRGGVIALGVGLLVFVLLTHDRLAQLATVAVTGAGAAILVAAAHARPVVEDGLSTQAAIDGGTEVLRLVVLVVLGTGLVQVAIGLLARHAARPPALAGSPRRAGISIGACLLVAIVVAVAAGVPGSVSNRWDDFSAPPGTVQGTSQRDVFSRIQSATSNGRYQYWQSAADAHDTNALKGIGAGSFELWWARNGTINAYVRNAHSLYMETYGELGTVGFALLVALLLTILGSGVVRTLRAPPRLRMVLAGTTAAIAVFMTSALYEWIWELAAVAATLMVLAAIVLAGRDRGASPAPPPPGWRGLVPRLVLVVLAVAALPVIALPLASAGDLRDSRAAAASGRLDDAAREARAAQRAQPYATTPRLQLALIAEEAGDLATARRNIRTAVMKEPTNWRLWFVRARIQVESGRSAAAVRSYRRARRLNPRSVLFAR